MNRQALPIAIGALVGLCLGALVWWLSRLLAARYTDSQETTDPSLIPTPSANGFLTVSAALVLAGMAAVGAIAVRSELGLPQLATLIVVTSLLVSISLVDFRVRRIPNLLVIALLLWAPVQVLWLGAPSVSSAGIGLLVGGGIFLLLAILQRGAMGAGDVKLMAAMGAILGYPLILYGFISGAIAGGIAAIVLLATRKAGRRDYMAYGPYLALGCWLVFSRAIGLWG